MPRLVAILVAISLAAAAVVLRLREGDPALSGPAPSQGDDRVRTETLAVGEGLVSTVPSRSFPRNRPVRDIGRG